MKLFNNMMSGLGGFINKRYGDKSLEPKQRKGDFSGFLGSLGLPDITGKVQRPTVLPLGVLKRLSNTDPIVWAIKKARKDQVSQCEWKIVRNTEKVETELDIWRQLLYDNLNPWGYKEEFKTDILSPELYGSMKGTVNSIMSSYDTVSNKKSKLKWYFHSMLKKVRSEADKRAESVNYIFDKPNSEQSNWQSFMGVVLEDILVFDAGIIIKNKDTSDTKLAELYTIPGDEVFRFLNEDKTIPKSPESAFVWEQAGKEVAQFTNDELIYISANPQQWGYGYSPLEVVAYVITTSLNIDSYNTDFFKEANIPPAILNLGKDVPSSERKAFQAMWNAEVQGKGGIHKMMFMSGAGDDLKLIPLRAITSRDMQMLEYLKWTLSIKAACYQISPQDIGFTMDLHRTTSEIQFRITKDRGLRSLLMLVENHINSEIMPEFGYDDIRFDYLGKEDKLDDARQTEIDNVDLNNSVISRNDRRIKIGLRPIEGGDVILVPGPEGRMVPIEQLENISDIQEEAKEEGGSEKGEKELEIDASSEKVKGEKQKQYVNRTMKYLQDCGFGDRVVKINMGSILGGVRKPYRVVLKRKLKPNEISHWEILDGKQVPVLKNTVNIFETPENVISKRITSPYIRGMIESLPEDERESVKGIMSRDKRKQKESWGYITGKFGRGLGSAVGIALWGVLSRKLGIGALEEIGGGV